MDGDDQNLQGKELDDAFEYCLLSSVASLIRRLDSVSGG